MIKNRHKYNIAMGCMIFCFIVVIVFVLPFSKGFRDTNFDMLLDSPCDPPCWYGVIPGVTTKNELKNIVETLPYYDDSTYGFYGVNDSRNYDDLFLMKIKKLSNVPRVGFYPNTPEVGFYLVDDVVEKIGIYAGRDLYGSRALFGQNLLGFSLKDAIGLFGIPDRLIIETNCLWADWCIEIHLIYPQQGVVVTVEGDVFLPMLNMREDLPVREVLYFAPDNSLDSAIEATLSNIDPCFLEYFSFEWYGYGPVQFDYSFDICDD
jgi:hypothetical protein